LLDEEGLEEFFGAHFAATAFRLEVRDSYAVDSDQDGPARYLAGEDPPDQGAWLAELRADAAAGKRWQWCRVLRRPLSDYLRYECEWGYAGNVAAGAQVRILDITGQPWPDGVPREEFWLLDDSAVLRMHYDSAGAFTGAEPAPGSELGRYRRARDAAWDAAEPFAAWWASHPGCHRDG
jgi:hypothetical protein